MSVDPIVAETKIETLRDTVWQYKSSGQEDVWVKITRHQRKTKRAGMVYYHEHKMAA